MALRAGLRNVRVEFLAIGREGQRYAAGQVS